MDLNAAHVILVHKVIFHNPVLSCPVLWTHPHLCCKQLVVCSHTDSPVCADYDTAGHDLQAKDTAFRAINTQTGRKKRAWYSTGQFPCKWKGLLGVGVATWRPFPIQSAALNGVTSRQLTVWVKNRRRAPNSFILQASNKKKKLTKRTASIQRRKE